MFDHRKEARKKLIKFTPVYKVHVVNPKSLLGYLVDLTLGGARVEGEHSAEVNQKMTISIEFPADLPDIPSAPIALAARVARCAPSDESPTLFNLGFEFVNLTPEQTKVIEAIIERYAFRREE
jgi:hypothetical protein